MIKKSILCILITSVLPACSPRGADHPSGLAPGELRVVSIDTVGPDPAMLLIQNGSFNAWLGSQPAPAGFRPPRNPQISTLLRDVQSGELNTTGYTALETWHALDATPLPTERFHTTLTLPPASRYLLRAVASASAGMSGSIGAYEIGADGHLRVLARNVVVVSGTKPARFEGTFETVAGGTVVLASEAREGSTLPGSITWSSWELTEANAHIAPATIADLPARRQLVNDALDSIRGQLQLYGSLPGWRESLYPLQKNVVRIQRDVEPRDGTSVLGDEAYVFKKSDLAYAAEMPDLVADTEGRYRPAWRAILDAERALAARGIHFIALPVPARIDLYMDRLYPPASKLPLPLAAHSDAVLQWLERDVLLLDPAPLLWRARHDGTTVFWRGDIEIPSGTAKILADAAAPLVKSLLGMEVLDPAGYEIQVESISLVQRLVPELMESQRNLVPAEEHALAMVRDADGELFQSPEKSPILVAGSYALAHQIRGASFAAHLSAALGVPVSIPSEHLEDPQVPAFLLNAPLEVTEARVVIFCFPAQSMTLAGWNAPE